MVGSVGQEGAGHSHVSRTRRLTTRLGPPILIVCISARRRNGKDCCRLKVEGVVALKMFRPGAFTFSQE
eukprot:252649-Prorocentrum_minimum.AAC.2